MRRAPCPAVGGSTTVASPVSRSIRAMWLPASDAYQTSPEGVAVIPYGPRPRGASNASTWPSSGSSLPYMPDWPVNQRTPSPSNAAVLRFASGWLAGSSNTSTSSVAGSTRTIAFRPPSVIHGAPSGPTITPCGAEPAPRSISRISPVCGSRWPSVPLCWPVYQTPPSTAGATSCGWLPAVTGYSTSSAAGRRSCRAARWRRRRRQPTGGRDRRRRWSKVRPRSVRRTTVLTAAAHEQHAHGGGGEAAGERSTGRHQDAP